MSKSDVYSDKTADIRMRIKVSRHVAEALLEKVTLIQTLTYHLHKEYEERRSPEDLSHRKAIIFTQWESTDPLLDSLSSTDSPVKKAITYLKSGKGGR